MSWEAKPTAMPAEAVRATRVSIGGAKIPTRVKYRTAVHPTIRTIGINPLIVRRNRGHCSARDSRIFARYRITRKARVRMITAQKIFANERLQGISGLAFFSESAIDRLSEVVDEE